MNCTDICGQQLYITDAVKGTGNEERKGNFGFVSAVVIVTGYSTTAVDHTAFSRALGRAHNSNE